MKISRFITFFVLFLGVDLNGQQLDTIFYDKNDNVVSSKKYDYFQLVEQGEKHVIVKEYSKSGKLTMEGQYTNMNLDKKTGPFYYYKKMRIYKFELYEPSKYPEILQQYRNIIDDFPDFSDSENLEIDYYKNGKIEFFGCRENCLFQGIWYSFKKNGELEYSVTYENGSENGQFIAFENKVVVANGYFKNGKEIGEWKFYNSDGKPIGIARFKDGKLVKRIPIYDEIEAPQINTSY